MHRAAALPRFPALGVALARSPEEVERNVTIYNEHDGFSFTTDGERVLESASRAFDGLAIGISRSSGHRATVVAEDSLLVAHVLSGQYVTESEGGTLHIRAGQSAMFRARERRVWSPGPALAVFATVPLRAGDPVAGQIAIAGEGGPLGGMLRAALGALGGGQNEDIKDSLAEAWRARIVAASPAGVEPGGAGSLGQVRHAEALLADRLGRTVTVPEVAAEIGISARALQLAFAAHRGVSPYQFLTLSRLHAARRRLNTPGPDDRVATVAVACGIAHVSRFIALYRQLFGETPAKTLAAARRRG